MAHSVAKEWGFILTSAGAEYFADQSSSVSNSLTDEIIRTELLESDFRAIPENCFEGVRIPVNPGETMIVQLAKALDISRPIGPEAEDEEDTTEEENSRQEQVNFKSAKRVVRLTLVSLGGGQRFEALEIRRIDCLTDSLVPGTKFLLRGPLRQQAGFVLLEANSNIKVLGGSVQRLAAGWRLNKDVKARRNELNAGADPKGPPRFISFLDFKKLSAKAKQALIPVSKPATQSQPIPKPEQLQRTVADSEVASEKVKQLKAAKISADAFAMKDGGGKGARRERTSRRDRDDLIEQYKPPSRSAPQLGAFVRFDKMTSLEDAQRLNDAVTGIPEEFEQPTFRAKGSGQPTRIDAPHRPGNSSSDSHPPGKGVPRREPGTVRTGKGYDRPGKGEDRPGKGSMGKGSSGKGSSGKGLSGKGSSSKGSTDPVSSAKGSSGKGSSGKGSSGKGKGKGGKGDSH
jgi:hypothetical protein